MPPTAPLSAFERKRQANMSANEAILKDISVVAKKIIPKKEPAKRAPVAKRTRPERVKREPTRPVRMSSRLAGIEADNDVLKRKMEVEAEHEAEKAKAKRMRVSGDLNLGDVAVEGKKWGNGVEGLQAIFRGAQPGIRTFGEEDVKETTDKGLKDLRLRMGGLKLYEQWAPNGAYPGFRGCVDPADNDLIQKSKSPRNGYMHLVFIPWKKSPSFLLAIKKALWVYLMPHKQPQKSMMTTRMPAYQIL